MTGRERINRQIERRAIDRIPVMESFWAGVHAEFHRQGVPEGTSLEEYFDLDAGMFFFDQSPRFATSILKQDRDTRTATNEWGETITTMKGHESTPGQIAVPVRNRRDWEEVSARLTFSDDRMHFSFGGTGMPDFSTGTMYQALLERDRWKILSVIGPYECNHHLFGVQKQLMLMFDDPDLLKESYAAHVTLIEQGLLALSAKGMLPDAIWIFDDVAYRNGMMFSPEIYRNFLKPFHRRIIECAQILGLKVVYHTDGNPKLIIPDLIEIGVDCLHPLEVKAGCDVRQLKRDFGDSLTFMGNIDARLFQENDIDGLCREIEEKVGIAASGGGYIFHSDHSIPEGTRLETYQAALEMVRSLRTA